MDQRGFGFAGALILVGVAALLWNFNVLPDRFLHAAWSLWPVALVAVGMGLVLTRVRVWLGSLAFLVILDGRIRHRLGPWQPLARGQSFTAKRSP